MRNANLRLERLEKKATPTSLPDIGVVVSHAATTAGVEAEIEAYRVANPTHLGPLIVRIEPDQVEA
jgi:hypothetical protein